MPGGPVSYASKAEERLIEKKETVARQRIADAYADKLEEILKTSPPEQQQKTAEAIYHVLGGFVHGYNPAECRIRKLIESYGCNSEKLDIDMHKIAKNIWELVFRD